MLRYATFPALAAAVLIAGCGSSSPSSGASADAKSQNNTTQGLRFSECMRSHGVPNFPDAPTGAGGNIQIAAQARAGSGASMKVNGVSVSAPAFQAAMQACKSYLPNAGTPSPAALAKTRQTALKFAQCMRSHGVPNFPDPQIGTGPGGGTVVRIAGGAGSVDPSSPAFKSAQAACGSIMGKGFASGAGIHNGP